MKTDIPDEQLIEIELRANGAVKQEDGTFVFHVCGEKMVCPFCECVSICNNELEGLKEKLWNEWQMLGHVAELATKEPHFNETSCLDNLLFLNYVKKAYLFSRMFDDLSNVSQAINRIFRCDISRINEDLVRQFNASYIEVKTLHVMVMKEIYRGKLLKRYGKLKKTASISGPWANLDLPFLERVYPYDNNSEHEEYMENRTRTKQQQTRYNPEKNMFGIFYSWEDLRRNPYDWSKWKEESSVPVRYQTSIP